MNILVAIDDLAGGADAVRTGQRIAAATGGAWRILYTPTFSWRELMTWTRTRARAREAVRQLYLHTCVSPTEIRIGLGTPGRIVDRDGELDRLDLIVMPAPGPGDTRTRATMYEILAATGRPVLATRGQPEIPPERVTIVTDPRDLHRPVLRSAANWLTRLPSPGRDPGRPFEVGLVHRVWSASEWTEDRQLLAAQLQDCMAEPRVVFTSARPEVVQANGRQPAHRSDLRVVFQDQGGTEPRPWLGKWASVVLSESEGSVLILPPERVVRAAASDALVTPSPSGPAHRLAGV